MDVLSNEDLCLSFAVLFCWGLNTEIEFVGASLSAPEIIQAVISTISCVCIKSGSNPKCAKKLIFKIGVSMFTRTTWYSMPVAADWQSVRYWHVVFSILSAPYVAEVSELSTGKQEPELRLITWCRFSSSVVELVLSGVTAMVERARRFLKQFVFGPKAMRVILEILRSVIAG